MKAQKVGTTMEGGEVEGIKYQLTEENPTFFYKRKKTNRKTNNKLQIQQAAAAAASEAM